MIDINGLRGFGEPVTRGALYDRTGTRLSRRELTVVDIQQLMAALHEGEFILALDMRTTQVAEQCELRYLIQDVVVAITAGQVYRVDRDREHDDRSHTQLMAGFSGSMPAVSLRLDSLATLLGVELVSE